MFALNAVLLAAVMPGFVVDDVKMRPGEDLVFAITGDGVPHPSAVKVERGDHALLMTLKGATLKAPRVFSMAGGHRVWARTNRGAVELQLPFDGAARCDLPARVRADQSTVSIVVHCPSAAATVATPAAAASVTAPAAKPVTVAEPVEAPRAAPAAEEPAKETAKEPAKDTAKPRTTVAASVTPPATPAETPREVAPAPLTGSAGGGGGSWLGFVALAALGGFAFWANKRRQAQFSDGLLEVVQTHAMGPKRSLVVAKMGNKTLLLSSCESGVQLLSEVADGPAPSLAPLAAASTVPAMPSIPVPPRPDAQFAAVAATGQAQGVHKQAFEQALEEVGEDQLLRRKLRLVSNA